MNRRNQCMGIGAAAGILVLILDGQTAIAGASDGIDLCIRTVIPSLFPFFLLSILLTSTLSGLNTPILRWLSCLCGTPAGTEALLITSFLGGYPVGAQCISRAYHSGQIKRTLAQRMLYFCNNAGPSFIFGMAAMQFSSPLYGWLIWAIQLLSAIAVTRCLPAGEETISQKGQAKQTTLTDALQSALRIMTTVCGWVVIFRVLIAFLSRWFFWLLPKDVSVFLTGLLELANGCCQLASVKNSGIRLILCSLMLSFGGLCVFMQTSSFLQGLSTVEYLKGKCLQTIYAGLFSFICQSFLPDGTGADLGITVSIATILFFICMYILRKNQKDYSICAGSIV